MQVRIKEAERDALRFHWKSREQCKIENVRFTRALFGLTLSPFLLGGVLEQHLKKWKQQEPELVAQIRKSLYVDDLISDAPTVTQAQQLKQGSTKIFSDAKFTWHKWNSNATEQERNDSPSDSDDQTFAKQQLGTKTTETKLLGLPWDKGNDNLSVPFPKLETEPTKRGVLSQLARIYDPLGLASPTPLCGKCIFRDICEQKLPWDAQIPRELSKKWKKWQSDLPECVTVERPIAPFRELIQSIDLHAFGDCAAVYAVVAQESGSTQGLLTAKSRLSKRNLTIPRLELVAGHMTANLAANVRDALEAIPHLPIAG